MIDNSLERLFCPRRMGDFVVTDTDYWKNDRWGNGQWPEGVGAQPRSCSYCGCAHIDEVITLIRDYRWEIEPSTKIYKWYINPPGHRLFLEEVARQFELEDVDPIIIENLSNNRVRLGGPPMKIYGIHTTHEQRQELQKLFLERVRTLRNFTTGKTHE